MEFWNAYIIILCFSGLATLFDIFSNDKDDFYSVRVTVYRMIFIFIAILGIAYIDTIPLQYIEDRKNYLQMFEGIPSIDYTIENMEVLESIRGEYGFLVVVSFLNALIPVEFRYLYFGLIYLTIIFIYYTCIKKYTKYWFLTLFGYLSGMFLWNEFVLIRTGIVTALLLFSIRYVYERNLIKYILLWLVAISIHISAVPALLLYWFGNIHWNIKRVIITLFITILLFNYNWIETIASIIGLEKLIMYFNSREFSMEVIPYSAILRNYTLIFIVVYFKNIMEQENEYCNVLLGMLILNTIFMGLFHEMVILYRAVMCIGTSFYFVLPWLLKKMTIHPIVKYSYIVLCCVYIVNVFSNSLKINNIFM